MPALTRQEIDALDSLSPWGGLVEGVFVGGCVERGDGSSFRRVAHAHMRQGDPHKGWICVRARRRLTCRVLMLHELAHIITGHGHDNTFRRELLRLGGSLDAHPMGDLGSDHQMCRGAAGASEHAPTCPCHTTRPDARLYRRCCGAEIWD